MNLFKRSIRIHRAGKIGANKQNLIIINSNKNFTNQEIKKSIKLAKHIEKDKERNKISSENNRKNKIHKPTTNYNLNFNNNSKDYILTKFTYTKYNHNNSRPS